MAAVGGMELEFTADVIEWRGPAPFVYAVVPEAEGEDIAAVARALTYGWGMVLVTATIGATRFTTALYPKDGGYRLPIRLVVQRAESIRVGGRVQVRLELGTP